MDYFIELLQFSVFVGCKAFILSSWSSFLTIYMLFWLFHIRQGLFSWIMPVLSQYLLYQRQQWNTRITCEISSKLTIKTRGGRQWLWIPASGWVLVVTVFFRSLNFRLWIPSDIYLFKVNNGNTRKMCKNLFQVNLLSANPTKWSNTLKQFVGKSQRTVQVCLTILWGWRLKVLTSLLEL